MKRIVFIRHGKPEIPLREDGVELLYGPEARLSEVGIGQIEWLASQLPRIHSIHVSPYQRTKDTAEVLAKTLKIAKKNVVLNSNIHDGFNESLRGITLDDAIAGNVPKHSTVESIDSIDKRVSEALLQIVDQSNTSFAIVSHGHPIRLMTLRFVEEIQGKIPPQSYLESTNYLNPGEALIVEVDDKGRSIKESVRIIVQPGNTEPGKRKR